MQPEGDIEARRRSELRSLATDTAPIGKLEQCPALLTLVSEYGLTEQDSKITQAQILRKALVDFFDYSYAAYQKNPGDERQRQVLGVGALLGFVPESPTTRQKPSEMIKRDDSNAEYRQRIAGAWQLKSVSDRTVREKLPAYLATFQNALYDYLEALRPEPAQTPSASDAPTPDIAADQAAENTAPQELTAPGVAPRKKRIWVAVTATTLVLVGGGITVVLVGDNHHHAEGKPRAVPTPSQVHMVGVKYTLGKGLYTHTQPNTTSPRGPGDSNFLSANANVGVVCQDRHGQSVSDPGNPKQGKQSGYTVWDKLANGLWISDLYTDLPVTSGDTLPPGIPAC